MQKKKSQGAFKKPDIFKKKTTNKEQAEKKSTEEFKLERDAVDVTESMLASKNESAAVENRSTSGLVKAEEPKEDPPAAAGGESFIEETVEEKFEEQESKPEPAAKPEKA